MKHPGLFFNDILAYKDSIVSVVDKRILKVFIDSILARMVQHEVVFDHLTNSYSKIHSEFLPYTQDTFKVLSKIVTDLVSEGG